MRLYVPRVGSHFRLIDDWSFSLYHDYRNQEALTVVGRWDPDWYRHAQGRPEPGSMTLPSGTEIVVDRVYIRQPSKSGEDNDYDSLTFLIRAGGLKGFGPGSRFFARLDDCNTMEVEVVGENAPTGIGASSRYKREAEGLPPVAAKKKATLEKNALYIRRLGVESAITLHGKLEKAIRRAVTANDEKAREVLSLILREGDVRNALDLAHRTNSGFFFNGEEQSKLIVKVRQAWDAKSDEKLEEPFPRHWWAHPARLDLTFTGKYDFNDDRTQVTQRFLVTVIATPLNVGFEWPDGITWSTRGTVTFNFPSGEVTDVILD